jgi:hypothetical protein
MSHKIKATFTFEVSSANFNLDLYDNLEGPRCADHLAECLERYLKSELMVFVEAYSMPRRLFDESNVYCLVEHPQEPRLRKP